MQFIRARVEARQAVRSRAAGEIAGRQTENARLMGCFMTVTLGTTGDVRFEPRLVSPCDCGPIAAPGETEPSIKNDIMGSGMVTDEKISTRTATALTTKRTPNSTARTTKLTPNGTVIMLDGMVADVASIIDAIAISRYQQRC